MQYITYQNTTPIIKSKASHSLETGENAPLKVFEVAVTHRMTDDSGTTRAGLFLLDYHLERLLESAKELGLWNEHIETHNRDWIVRELALRIRDFAGQDLVQNAQIIFYIVVSKEGFELLLDWFEWPRQPFAPISLVSAPAIRKYGRHKTSLMEASIEGRKKAHQRHAQEALLVDDDGLVHDCAWSSLFWVNKDGELCTCNNEQTLPGVIRRIVLEQIPTSLKNTSVQELVTEAKEVFITQSSTGVTPVLSIDDRSIGSECPGTWTMKVGAQYNRWLETMCVPLDRYLDEFHPST